MKVIDLIKGIALLSLIPLLMGHGVSFGPTEEYVNSNMYSLKLNYCKGSGIISFKTAAEEDVLAFEPFTSSQTKELKILEGETFHVHIESSSDTIMCEELRLIDDRGLSVIVLARRISREGLGTFLDAMYQLRSSDFFQSSSWNGDSKDHFILSAGRSEFDPIFTPGLLHVYHNASLIYSNDTVGFSDPVIFDAIENDFITVVVNDVNSSGTMDPIWLHKSDGTSYTLSYKAEFTAGSESNTTYKIWY